MKFQALFVVVVTLTRDVKAMSSNTGCERGRRHASLLHEKAGKCDNYMAETGCGWTADWNCPGQSAGAQGAAGADGSLGYECCCTDGLWNQGAQKCDNYMAETGCGWTANWNCPGQSAGVHGSAGDDGSLGYECCCTDGLWNQVPQHAPPPQAPQPQQTPPVGADYRGTLNRTGSGRTCQKWTAQSPHQHSRTLENYPNGGLGDHNYCRNPDSHDCVWCYTTDASTRWECCDLQQEVGVSEGPKCCQAHSAECLACQHGMPGLPKFAFCLEYEQMYPDICNPRPYCLKIVTGDEDYDGGNLRVSINVGEGLVEVASSVAAGNVAFERKQTVVSECYSSPVILVEVTNPTSNAWAGSVQHSLDGGDTFTALRCSSGCNSMGSTARVVVEGDRDGADMAPVSCSGGAVCQLTQAR